MASIFKKVFVLLLWYALTLWSMGSGNRALATPYIDVVSRWSLEFEGYELSGNGEPLPAGIDLSCEDSSGGDGSCFDTASLITDVTSSAQFLVSKSGALVITNNTDQSFTSGDLIFQLGYAPFNPGGSDVGLSIDDPVTQSASFSSIISAPDFNISSTIACGVGFRGDFDQVFSPTTCGLESPDESFDTAFLAPFLEPGQSTLLPVQITIMASFEMNEPSGLAVVAASTFAILALSWMRARRPD